MRLVGSPTGACSDAFEPNAQFILNGKRSSMFDDAGSFTCIYGVSSEGKLSGQFIDEEGVGDVVGSVTTDTVTFTVTYRDTWKAPLAENRPHTEYVFDRTYFAGWSGFFKTVSETGEMLLSGSARCNIAVLRVEEALAVT